MPRRASSAPLVGRAGAAGDGCARPERVSTGGTSRLFHQLGGRIAARGSPRASAPLHCDSAGHGARMGSGTCEVPSSQPRQTGAEPGQIRALQQQVQHHLLSAPGTRAFSISRRDLRPGGLGSAAVLHASPLADRWPALPGAGSGCRPCRPSVCGGSPAHIRGGNSPLQAAGRSGSPRHAAARDGAVIGPGGLHVLLCGLSGHGLLVSSSMGALRAAGRRCAVSLRAALLRAGAGAGWPSRSGPAG
jgi:hypothetical protein